MSAEQQREAGYDALVAAFRTTGFRGADAWYLNDAANLAYAAEAPDFGRLRLPVLFLHAAWDPTCDTAHTRLAEPMRADCADLREVTIAGGHELMLECPAEVNALPLLRRRSREIQPGRSALSCRVSVQIQP